MFDRIILNHGKPWLTHFSRQIGIIQKPGDALGQGVYVSRSYQKSGFGVTHRFLNSDCADRDNGQGSCLGLQKGEALNLNLWCRGKKRGQAVHAGQVAISQNNAGKVASIPDAELHTQAHDFIAQLAISDACVNDDCTMRIEKNELPYSEIFLGDKVIGDFYGGNVNFHSYDFLYYQSPDFQTLNNLCTEDRNGDFGAIQQLYDGWEQGKDFKFEIVSYSSKRADYLLTKENNLLSCINANIAREGDWLAYYSSVSEYCTNSILPSTCGVIPVVSPLGLISFIFSNPGPTTYPYILAVYAILIFFASTLIVMNSRGIMKDFFRLSLFKKWGLVFSFPLLFIVTLINIQYTLLFLIVYYYLLSTGQYLWNSRRSSMDSLAEK